MIKNKSGIILDERKLVAVVTLAVILSVGILIVQQGSIGYCGDGFCSTDETPVSCARDCGGRPDTSKAETPSQPPETVKTGVEQPAEPPGEQPSQEHSATPDERPSYQHNPDRELNENIFEDTIGVEQEDAYKKQGYVIVRYFYNTNCLLCTNPVKWDEVLMELAREMNDVIILEMFDSSRKQWAKERWGKAGIDVIEDPVIRIEGMPGGKHAYKILYGNPLTELFGAPKERLVEQICEYTDVC